MTQRLKANFSSTRQAGRGDRRRAGVSTHTRPPRTALLRVALLLPCLVAPRCGPASPESATADLDTFLTSYLEVLCDNLVRCPRADPRMETASLCRARLASSFQQANAPLRSALEASRTRFDAARGQRCLAQLRGYCFSQSPYVSEACAYAFEGSIPPGGACLSSWECAGDAFCGSPTATTCPGTCRPRVPLGGSCNGPDHVCAGLDARRSCFANGRGSTGAQCVSVTVSGDIALGQPCDSAIDQGTPRVTSTACAPGLYCSFVGHAGVPRTCRQPIPVGGACNSQEICEGTNRCQSSAPSAPMSCQPHVVRSRAGESCGPDGPECNVYHLLRCVDGRCAVPGDGSLGSRCEPRAGEVLFEWCAPGLYCEGSTRRCENLKAVGAPCLLARECRTGLCNGTCQSTGCPMR